MVIFGSGTKVLTEEVCPSLCCQHCGNAAVSACVVQRYFHIFWIPVLPSDSTA